MGLPAAMEATPHCVERPSWSCATKRAASSMRPRSSSGLERGRLGRHEPEHDLLVVGRAGERLERPRAGVVVLKEKRVEGRRALEKRPCDVLVAAAGHPHPGVVAAAQVDPQAHPRHTIDHRVDEVDPLGEHALGGVGEHREGVGVGAGGELRSGASRRR
jgi:hypothetical protein